MDPPTLDEWSSMISSMPNDKAPGPSMISYEMLKHFGLLLLLNLVASHQVLQGGNFAGLPGGSCHDPIITLESIIHDSVVTKQPLWILSQDILKAFDSVDLNMLRFAFQRLRLLNNAIQFLLSLFMARSNRVITAHSPTPPYRVRIGIDQGEVISPLLWVIYLDPLLTALKLDKKDPYCLISPSVPATLSSISTSHDILYINNLVFMDDSTLISSSKEGMEHMLLITEEFYHLNNTSANYNKYVLATNAVSTTQDLSPVNFNLPMSQLNSTSAITVTPIPTIPMSSSFCFLGVWFNINGSQNFIRKQLKQECNSFSATLHPAKLTVQQVALGLIKLLFAHQQQSHFTNLFLLANSSSFFMKSLFIYRLRFIQFYCLIPISPLLVLDWSYWSSLTIFKQDYITNTIASLVLTPFRLLRANLSSVPDLTYPQRHTPLYNCLSLDVFKSNLGHSIQKRGNARIPNWYKNFSSNVTHPDQSGLLQDRFMMDQPMDSTTKELIPCTPPSGHKKNWIVTLDNEGIPLFGKQIQLQPARSTCTIAHWISDCVAAWL
ncbi:unnamed protein product [Rhizophagus irregularis]|nr:unnamed protein product [Rhizophagus irregularis]